MSAPPDTRIRPEKALREPQENSSTADGKALPKTHHGTIQALEESHEKDAGNSSRMQFEWWEIALIILGVLLSGGVSTIGLVSSYEALEAKAHAWGWGQAWMLPIGIDLSILAFSIVNLLLVKFGRPLTWVKWVPRGATATTIYLNWEASGSLPSQIGHAALASLWVVFSEIAAHLYAAHITTDQQKQLREKIPLSRWINSPIATARIARRMVLWGITSYPEAVQRDQELRIYTERLRQKHGKRWRRTASRDELLPLSLARYGLTVDQALAVPVLEDIKALQRETQGKVQRAEEEIQQAEAEVQLLARRLQAQVQKERAESDLELERARAEVARKAEVQRGEAELQRLEAERQADLQRLRDEADARARQAAEEAARREEEARRQREDSQLKWEMEHKRRREQMEDDERTRQAESQARAAEEEAKREKAEADRAAAERRKAEDLDRAAELKERAAERQARAAEEEAKREKAEAERAAAERAKAEELDRAAELEVLAAERLAMARMTPAEWQAHRVASMIRHRGKEKVTIDVIRGELGVSAGTASARMHRALEILQSGPQALPSGITQVEEAA